MEFCQSEKVGTLLSSQLVLLRHLNLTRSDGVNNLDTGISWVINWCLGRKLSGVEIVMGDV